jgi:hypothetical protein
MKKSKEINNNEPINTYSDDSSSDEFETNSNVVIGFVDDSIKDLTADEKILIDRKLILNQELELSEYIYEFSLIV